MEKLDPITFAVIKARFDGTVIEMTNTIFNTSRNPILWASKDFTCVLLTYDAKLLTMVNGLPMHAQGVGNALPPVVECFKGDIHPGDAFCKGYQRIYRFKGHGHECARDRYTGRLFSSPG